MRVVTARTLTRADARLPCFCFALAASGIGGAADHLVAFTGDTAGTAADCFPCDPAPARAGAARRNAGSHPVVADFTAHDARGAGDFRGRPPTAEPAGAPRLDRSDPCDRRRWLGGGARLAGTTVG